MKIRKYIVKLEECKNEFTGKKSYRIVGTNIFLKKSEMEKMKRFSEIPTARIETGAFQRGFERGKELGYKNGYREGSEKAWNIAKAIMTPKSLGGMPAKQFRDLFYDFEGEPKEVFINFPFEKVEHRMKRKQMLPE